MFSVGSGTLPYLDGEFARRGQHQSPDCFRLCVGKTLQDGQDKSGRLARPGLGTSEHIFTAQGNRNRLGLNRGWGFVLDIFKGA